MDPCDREVVKWALDRAAAWYYTQERELPAPVLKVQCGHVTAYFHRGELVRLWAHADSDHFDDLFAELTQLFRVQARTRAAHDDASLAFEQGFT